MAVIINDTLEMVHPAEVGKLVFTNRVGGVAKPIGFHLIRLEAHFGKVGHNSTSYTFDVSEEECAALRNYLNRQLKAYDHRVKK